jgi:hypothetical protein
VMRKKRGENVEGKKGETQKKTEIKKWFLGSEMKEWKADKMGIWICSDGPFSQWRFGRERERMGKIMKWMETNET